MSDRWEFYFCRVEDRAASVFVDLGIVREAPRAEQQQLGRLAVAMRVPRTDGLSSQEEYDVLSAMEDVLEEWERNASNASYVGRVTSGGFRTYYLYAARATELEDCVTLLRSKFPDYRYELGMGHDPGWNSYLKFLYPSPEEMRWISDRRVCDALQSHGDEPEVRREIDHWAYFPDERSRAAFLAFVDGLGFRVRHVSDPDEETDRFAAQIFREDRSSFSEINDVALQLQREAERCGGDYDGWESPVVSRESGARPS